MRSTLVSLLFLAAVTAQTPPGACLVQDSLFATNNGGCQDLTAGRVWSASTYPGQWTWSPAINYCLNLVQGGFDDWRLPTRDELVALYQHGGYTHLNIAGPYGYWSSTDRGNRAWQVRLDTGVQTLSTKTSSFIVLCTRTPSGPRAASSGGGSIQVTQVIAGDGRTLLLDAPRLAGRSYLVVARPQAAAGVLQGAGPIVSLGAGQLDGAGRAVVGVGAPGPEIALALVVVDPSAPAGVVVLPVGR